MCLPGEAIGSKGSHSGLHWDSKRNASEVWKVAVTSGRAHTSMEGSHSEIAWLVGAQRAGSQLWGSSQLATGAGDVTMPAAKQGCP